MVDGTRTVQDIIDRSLLGRFNACEILAYLFEIGLIEIASVQTPGLGRKVGAINFKRTFPAISAAGLLFLIFVLLIYFAPNVFHQFLDSGIERVDFEIPTHWVQKAQLERIKNALDIYYLEKGNYPARLEELVPAQLLRKKDLFYRKGISYQYELGDGKYSLKH